MHKRMALNGLALLGLLASSTVLAETQPGFYAGAGVGQTSIEADGFPFGLSFDEEDTSFKVFGGYNFNRYFAIEATYFDGGAPSADYRVGPASVSAEVETTGLVASVLGRLPIGDIFSVYGKLGFASYDADFNASARQGNFTTQRNASVSDEDVTYGIGASFNLGTSFELRGEYESVDVSDGDFTVLSVSGLFKF